MTAPRNNQEVSIIPAPQSGVMMLCAQAFLAIIAGFALRLLLALRFPALAGDSKLYIELARNWADHRVYGLWLNGQLIPTDLRVPGYPAFLAGIAIILGRSVRAILLSQVAIDLCTCLLTAALAATLVPETSRRRVGIAALWLSSLCPFVANYTATVLTEVLAAFFATAALFCFAMGLKQQVSEFSLAGHRRRITAGMFTCLGGFLTGLASLVHPEMPLLLAVAGAMYALRWWKPLGWRKVVFDGAAISCAFFLPLIPWAARNFVTLNKVQILAPRYATLPGEYAPVGYYAWTNTWLERFHDVYATIWKITEEPMNIDDLPATAFDSPDERGRIASLFNQYNNSSDMDISPEVDREFAQIARERTRRNPLRTYVEVPFQRALTIWFTPRTELLPSEGSFWPISENWEDSRPEFLITVGFAFLGYLYAALALGGIWRVWRTARPNGLNSRSEDLPNLWGVALLLGYLLVRTAFLTTVEAPEPRYVVTCYPAVLALVALLWVRS